MMTHKLLLAAGAGLLVAAQSSMAASIGVNLAGDGDANRNLAPGETAGVVAQSNWNNLTGGPAGGTLTQTNAIDDSGVATSADFSFVTSAGNVHTSNAGSGDLQLFNYGLFMSPTAGNTLENIVTISEIPYAVYDVILYIGRNHSGTAIDDRVWRFRLGTEDIYAGELPDGAGDTQPFTSYILATGTDYTAADANYGVFSNVSGASITIQGAANTGRETLSAIQIVEVPEPGSLALLGLGGLCVLRRRRS